MSKRLGESFYRRDASVVAPALLGKVLVLQSDQETMRARIVEVEAYLGERDEASHAFRGRTLRNDVMFGPPGHIYIYFTYGMHFCMNIVTAKVGEGQAVLLRALEPLGGIAAMIERRQTNAITNLCNGPAKLVQALGLGRSDNGRSLLGAQMWIEDDDYRPQVTASPRVGISKAVDLPLRFFITGSEFVSKPNKSRYNVP